MAWLKRLVSIVGVALWRISAGLLRWSSSTAAASAPILVDETDQDDGPPAHWLATVRARAPWLLVGDRASRRSVPRRPLVRSVQRGPEVNALRAEGPPDEVGSPVVRPSGGPARAASPAPSSGRPGRPSPVSLLQSVPEAPSRQVPSAGPMSRPAADTPQPTRREPPNPAGFPPVSRGVGISEPRPVLRSPARRAAASEPSSGSSGRTGSRVSDGGAPSAAAAPPRLSGQPRERPNRAATDATAPPWRDAPAAPPATVVVGHKPPGRDASRGAAPIAAQTRTLWLLPPTWPAPEHAEPARVPAPADHVSTPDDDRWPGLPDTEWELWQTSEIESPLPGSRRADRLRAEQAGSSWSVPPF
jgi:hypothetical protein